MQSLLSGLEVTLPKGAKCFCWRGCQDGAEPLLGALALPDAAAAALAAALLRYSLLFARPASHSGAPAQTSERDPAAERGPQSGGASAGPQNAAADPAAPSGGMGAELQSAVAERLAAAAAEGRDPHAAGAGLLAELVMTLPPGARDARLRAVLGRLARAPDQAPAARDQVPQDAGNQAAVQALAGLLRWPLEADGSDAVVAAAAALPRCRAAGRTLAAALALLPPGEAVPPLVRALGAAGPEAECAAVGEMLLGVLVAPGAEVAALGALLRAVRELPANGHAGVQARLAGFKRFLCSCNVHGSLHAYLCNLRAWTR